jgi:uncharacterized protein YbaR (Trm112 family)
MDQKLIDILICPVTGKPLRFDKNKPQLITIDNKISYPIIDGIPRLTPDDAIRQLDET